MFSFFRSRASTEIKTPVSVEQIEEEDGAHSDDDRDNSEGIDLAIEVGGGKGWPIKATVLLFHPIQGVICVGTESGAIYVYGDGFQFVRPWLTDDPVEVVSIVAVHPDKIVALYADNSVVAMELPALNVIDLLQPNWLSEKEGDVTAMYCDTVGEKGFVYIGTSSGSLHVLDCMHTMLRVCDYKVTLNDFGLTSNGWTISDIQSSPKDDRYIAVGFDGGEMDFGAVVVYDFAKGKAYKNFKIPSVTSLQWHHAGEILYAGTMDGKLYLINIEKGSCNIVWNGNEEKVDDLDEDNEFKPAIRRLHWVPSQNTIASEVGCLFLQLSSPGADNDNLKNVVIGLTPSSNYNEYQVAFAMPPLPMEKVVAFRIVPTYEKEDKLKVLASFDNGGDEDINNGQIQITPAIMLLVHRSDEYEPAKFERHLKIIRCPTSNISDWGFEIGTLPDARKACEVLAGPADVTCIEGFVPDFRNIISLGRNLISGVINDEDKLSKTGTAFQAPDLTSMPSTNSVLSMNDTDIQSNHHHQDNTRPSRRISARDFFTNNQSQLLSTTELDLQLSQYDTWEMVLSSGLHEEHNRDKQLRYQDIIFLGHSDGTIIAYGVSLPDGDKEFGKGSIWLHLAALRCGTTNITKITYDDHSGLIAFADEAGYFVIYQLYDENNNIGTYDVLRQTYDQTRSDADNLISSNITGDKIYSKKDLIDTFEEHKFRHYDYCNFNNQRVLCRTRFTSPVTSILILGSLLMVCVGLADGSVFICTDMLSGTFNQLIHSDSTGATSSVLLMEYSYYLHNGVTTTVLMVYFQSGHIVIFDMNTNKVIAFNVAWSIMNADNKDDNEKAPVGKVLNGKCKPIEQPSLLATLYLQALNKSIQNTSFSMSNSLNTSSNDTTVPPPPPGNLSPVPEDKKPSSRRTTFFFSRAAALAQPPPSQTLATGNDRVVNMEDILLEQKKKGGITLDTDDTPVELAIVHGKQLVRFSLSKMITPTVRRKGDTMSEITKGASGSKVYPIAKKQIIMGCDLFLCHDSDGDVDQQDHWLHYFSGVDSEGLLRLIDVDKKKPICYVNLLEGITFSHGDEIVFTHGCSLPNGNYYLIQQGGMIHASTMFIKDTKIRYVLPDRASATCEALSPKLMLLHGREQKKEKAQKRRSSVMKLINNATSTDLYKVFSKTREQQKKEELFESSSPKRSDTGSSFSSDDRNRPNTSKITSDMAEIRENFQERGEKINKIAIKMSDFRQSAQQFKQAAAQERQRLERQNNRWGLF